MPRPTASTPLRLYLLGPFRLERGKEPLRLSTRKVESLLAFLVLHPEEHSREKLAALFWGDSPDAQARDSLRTALKNLRKALGDELLLADREAIQLNPEYPLWVDAREFEQTADDRPQTTHAQTAVSGLSSAVTLYRGDLLTDFYDEWILPERERLRELYLATLLRLTQDARTRGEYAQAIELAKKVLALDAANERAHRHLMFCYHANGDRAAALKQHEACVRILRDELGVAPSPETTALYEEIKSAVSEIPAPETQLTNLPIPLTSFVGRQREIEEIKAILARERLVTLTGAGGSGKTRLAIEVARGFVGAVAHHHARELSTDEFQDRVTMRQESPRPYTDGVWWVELAALSDAALVPQAIAQVLAVREVSHQPMLETLANHLRARQLLLLLDNCEHLINACAELADSLLSMCPHLKILATSREALGILGESVYQVPSLLLPLTLDVTVHQVLQYEATRLFVERASAANARFALTTQNAPAVAQICRRLDGIPLPSNSRRRGQDS